MADTGARTLRQFTSVHEVIFSSSALRAVSVFGFMPLSNRAMAAIR